MSSNPPERSYTSPLRRRQQEMTRTLIMRTLADLIAEGAVHTFTVQEVADRAGISYGSVYRHFPSREALLNGLTEWGDELVASRVRSDASTIDEIPVVINRAMEVFEENGPAVVAVLTMLAGSGTTLDSKRRRDEKMFQAVAESLPELEPGEARKVWAILRLLASSEAWAAMRFRLGLNAGETVEAMNWALQTLIDDAKRRAGRTGRPEKEK